uniref:Uncharacterized protein n=1 Tax=Arundo donax TaxID=35708 RepID=A0A0A9B3G4_ARUDO
MSKPTHKLKFSSTEARKSSSLAWISSFTNNHR